MSGEGSVGGPDSRAVPWPISVYSITMPRMTPSEAIKAVSAAGYDAILWKVKAQSGPTPSPVLFQGQNLCMLENSADALDEARRACEAADLRVSGLSFGREIQDPERQAEMIRALDLCERAGAPNLRLTGGSMLEGQRYSEAYEATLRMCAAYEKLARGRPVRALVHQHYGTAAPSATALHRIVSQFDPAAIGAVYDPGNMTVEGYEEYRIGIGMLGEYIADIHIKNSRYWGSGKGGVWEREWSPLDDGLVDLPRMFRALSRTDYQGWITQSDFFVGPNERRQLAYNRRVIVDSIHGVEGVYSHTPYRPVDHHATAAAGARS